MYLTHFSPFDSLRDQIDDLFDGAVKGCCTPAKAKNGTDQSAVATQRMRTWLPPVELAESEKDLKIQAEIPGVDPKDIEISVTGRVLTIRGEKKEEREENGKSFYRSERRYGSFQRTVELPDSVDTAKIEAGHKDGVVTITIQKNEKAAPRRIPLGAMN